MLYVMRHGKTDWNEKYKLQGQTDIPLNDAGRKMAIDASKQYQEIEFDVCFCSPLKRAYETAQLFLRDRNVPIIVDERIREMGFGIYEGSERVYSKPELPVHTLFKDPVHYVAVDGAESIEELYSRTGEFIKEKVEPLLEENKNVLIIAHGAVNSCIINQFWDIPLEDFWKNCYKNCELIKIK